jgi:putative phosphoesterase
VRIGLVSDSHGDPTAWERAMGVLGDLDLITHAGDVLYHGIFNPITETYNPRRLAELLNESDIPRVHARGNCDSEVDQLALDAHILSDFAFVSAEGVRILITHGHKYPREELVLMAAKAKADILHIGHFHEPEITVVQGVVVFNAGSCALPKQEGEKPTVGLLEDGRLQVFDTETGEVYSEAELRG